MTTAQAQIYELFKALPIEDQRDLLSQLSETVEGEDLLDDLSPDQVAAIEESIAQMKRGETIGADELFDSLAKEFAFSRT
jgi:dsDNA-specific endonuclease/ATPase MutS2